MSVAAKCTTVHEHDSGAGSVGMSGHGMAGAKETSKGGQGGRDRSRGRQARQARAQAHFNISQSF